MKLLTCMYEGQEIPAVLSLDRQSVLPLHELGYPVRNMNQLIQSTSPEDLRIIAARARTAQNVLPLNHVALTAPIPHPVRDIICMGLNYLDHAAEMARALNEETQERKWPIYFGKAVDRCRGEGEPVLSHRDFISTLDYECELGVILGKDVYQVSREEASSCIFGYTIINDVTARELSRHRQNYFMKSLDGTCPMGPWIVTADELPFPPRQHIRLWVNDELRQDGSTGDMLFGIDEIISTLSQGVTLQAGTIFATGSPTGIGFGMDPPVFLKHGDVMTCEIEGIGRLTNPVMDLPAK
ncbi:fumarylacetoacetate hydrolase family protein [Pseudoflavonifractor phocaeensis]|uniref:fumarylacetoacetate hydrolase family protein n=1 Tax=Pseudoflavonifractor phocaeensis TaxID=1870988 RepID=UPI00210983AE|nr:fumarylacetoacetate hydrolase family protein [Pseudoflavonifractor phocaeensis]MCQ4864634.1 fumarylacetoacetate hydrolase family protein [Pseudoflavonifractor phocaeensis]